jgi:hypothetical protein
MSYKNSCVGGRGAFTVSVGVVHLFELNTGNYIFWGEYNVEFVSLHSLEIQIYLPYNSGISIITYY